MRNITIIKYLLTAIDNGYINKFTVKQINNYNISIVIDIEDEENIKIVCGMIEANLYINKWMLVKDLIRLEDGIIVNTYNGIIYNIRVKSKRSNKKNKNKRIKNER